MTYHTSLSFDSVAVVESLPRGELRTGRDLSETVLFPASLADSGFGSELYVVENKHDFLGALHSIRDTARTYGRSPIVHIESHGDMSGIYLANGDLVGWNDVAPVLTEINIASRMNLLVVAAMCHGWHMISVLRPIARTPAFAIIGSEAEVPAALLLEAMQRFYRTLLGPGNDLRAALAHANLGVAREDWEFVMEGAELWMCRIFKHYTLQHDTEDGRLRRVNQIVTALTRDLGGDLDTTMRVRTEIDAALADTEQWFEFYRHRFLLLDMFPENAARFPLSFKDCAANAG